MSLWKNDLADLKQAISEMLILVCLESSVTQVKQKCLKALKILPLTNMITKLISIRLNDLSCITREICLDLLGNSNLETLIQFANDKSSTVRQKVVQLLSRCLDSSVEVSSKVI